MKIETTEKVLGVLFAAFVVIMCSSFGAVIVSGAYAVVRKVFLEGCG